MKWRKKGLIYSPNGKIPWAIHSALQPTPFLLSDNVIRVYAGFRDQKGVGRIGFVDLDADNPGRILGVSEKPVLDIGIPGTFDENGVVPSAIVRREGKLYLYFAGYQLGQKVRFYVLGGLAISEDGGNCFYRCSKVPVLERSDKELFFRVIHSTMFEKGVWRIWYGAGSQWIQGRNEQLPIYDIRYLESSDGINMGKEGRVCIGIKGGDEHRLGRPYVIRDQRLYRMFYSIGTQSKNYRLGYAESMDGLTWVRKDEEVGITVSERGWDSQMMAYPSITQYKDKVYMFYNGNDYGKAGFGYAILEEW